jgi:hypothetical protein
VLDFLTQSFDSRTFPAFIFFAIFNLTLSIVFTHSPVEFSDTTLVQNPEVFTLISATTRPWDVVLMGSSFMIAPFSLMDDLTWYSSNPANFARAINKATASSLTVENLSVEAAMVSDQYILLEKYLKDQLKPRIIVLGISPRDFNDSRWKNPSDTYCFNAVLGLDKLYLCPLYLDNVGQYAGFFVNRLVPLYRYRKVILRGINQQQYMLFELLVMGVTPQAPPPMVSTDLFSAEEQSRRVEHNLNEYISVYSTLANGKSYSKQLPFVTRIIDLCEKRKIFLVLVNLPITALNKSLLPAGFYRQYQLDVAKVARAASSKKGIFYLDLTSGSGFSDTQDFWDTIHLNAHGGWKVTQKLSPIIADIVQQKHDGH